MYFDDQANEDVTAEEIVRRLKRYIFIVSLHFLSGILSNLGQLNKTFQLPTYHPCDAYCNFNRMLKNFNERLKASLTYCTYRDGGTLDVSHGKHLM